MASNPHKLFRQVHAETNDPLAAIRAVREVFGMSVSEAKEVWLQATGQAPSLTAHQEKLAAEMLRIVCPRCLSDGRVTRKMHALPPGLGYDGTKAIAPPGPAFVHGHWCAACELGFVPDHLLAEYGLEKVRPI
jgi:hypothetical protein